jgi:DNA-binding NarL/FixJ family response regulator
MEYFAAPRPAAMRAAFPGLTEREREVVELIAKGDTNAAIATRLGISAKTVRNHVSNIFTKLQVTDRAHAIVRARDAGLGTSEADA